MCVSMCSRPRKTEHKWFFYEVYKSKDDFKSHQQTSHYLQWRDTVNNWMAEPRKGERS